MRINLDFATLVLMNGEKLIPLEALIAFPAILVALLMPVAIMIFQEKHGKNDRLPNWFTDALLSQCAKPKIMLASIICCSLSLFTYNWLPWPSLMVYVISCMVFTYRSTSIYRWYKESISYPSPDNGTFIQNHIIHYLERFRDNASNNSVYVWRETWQSRFAAHTITPRLLEIFLETLRNSREAKFDDLIRTLDGQILTGKIPIYDKSILPRICSIAIDTIQERGHKNYAYLNILLALMRRSVKDERCDLVLSEIDKQLRTTDNEITTQIIEQVLQTALNELFDSSIDNIHRTQFKKWRTLISNRSNNEIDSRIRKTIIQKFRLWAINKIYQLDYGSASKDKTDYIADKLQAVEQMIFGGTIDIEQLNIALSLEVALLNEQKKDIESVISNWISKNHPYIQHNNDAIIDIIDANPQNPTLQELHEQYIAKQEEFNNKTIDIVKSIAPGLSGVASEIYLAIKNNRTAISQNTSLPSDAPCKLHKLLNGLAKDEKETK